MTGRSIADGPPGATERISHDVLGTNGNESESSTPTPTLIYNVRTTPRTFTPTIANPLMDHLPSMESLDYPLSGGRRAYSLDSLLALRTPNTIRTPNSVRVRRYFGSVDENSTPNMATPTRRYSTPPRPHALRWDHQRPNVPRDGPELSLEDEQEADLVELACDPGVGPTYSQDDSPRTEDTFTQLERHVRPDGLVVTYKLRGEDEDCKVAIFDWASIRHCVNSHVIVGDYVQYMTDVIRVWDHGGLGVDRVDYLVAAEIEVAHRKCPSNQTTEYGTRADITFLLRHRLHLE